MTSSAVTTYACAGSASPAGRLTGPTLTGTSRANGEIPCGKRTRPETRGLPEARAVLAVTARPGVESTVLGGLLYAFGQAGARITLLSLTRGEASPLNCTSARLEAVRPWELQLASWLLGVSSVAIADFPDGRLNQCAMPDLAERVRRAIAQHGPDLILVQDPAAGSCDDARVTEAVRLAAGPAGVPVAARTKLGSGGGWLVELGEATDAARAVQRAAARAHASQSDALAEEFQRLDSLTGREQLRWLVPAAGSGAAAASGPRCGVPRLSAAAGLCRVG